jgi:hypothetical protein
MAKSRTHPVSLDGIRAALRTAAEKFLRAIAEGHRGETLYGFLFEISCEGFSAHGAAATEEQRRRYAEQYAAQHGGDADRLRSEFRWGSTEDAWYQQPDAAFGAVNRLLARAEREELYEVYGEVLLAAAARRRGLAPARRRRGHATPQALWPAASGRPAKRRTALAIRSRRGRITGREATESLVRRGGP